MCERKMEKIKRMKMFIKANVAQNSFATISTYNDLHERRRQNKNTNENSFHANNALNIESWMWRRNNKIKFLFSSFLSLYKFFPVFFPLIFMVLMMFIGLICLSCWECGVKNWIFSCLCRKSIWIICILCDLM